MGIRPALVGAVLALAVGASGAPLTAQRAPDADRIGSASLLGGWSRLVGQNTPDGGSIGGSARFMAEFGRIAAGLDGGYARFGESTLVREGPCRDRSGTCTFTIREDATSWRAAGLLRADLSAEAPLRPHLTGGLGLYAISQFGSALHFLGYSLGAGATLGGADGGLRWLLDVRWHDNLQVLAVEEATGYVTVELGVGVGW